MYDRTMREWKARVSRAPMLAGGATAFTDPSGMATRATRVKKGKEDSRIGSAAGYKCGAEYKSQSRGSSRCLGGVARIAHGAREDSPMPVACFLQRGQKVVQTNLSVAPEWTASQTSTT